MRDKDVGQPNWDWPFDFVSKFRAQTRCLLPSSLTFSRKCAFFAKCFVNVSALNFIIS